MIVPIFETFEHANSKFIRAIGTIDIIPWVLLPYKGITWVFTHGIYTRECQSQHKQIKLFYLGRKC